MMMIRSPPSQWATPQPRGVSHQPDREGREPEWDDEQLELALAFAEFQRGIGPNGEQLAEATSPKADPNYYKPDAIRYAAHGPFTNWAEKRRLDAIDQYKKAAGDNPNLNGMFWTVEKLTD